MKPQLSLLYLAAAPVLAAATGKGCKCTPSNDCWPSPAEWTFLNKTLHGSLIRGNPPASVCYPSQPNYNAEACAQIASQWFNSSWHAEDPISTDYPIWTNNSCNPIWPNGTSVTGDATAGARGCSLGAYPVYVVNATCAEDVSTALIWAGEKNVRVVIKNTGHSFPGRSIGYGSLSIWTHNFRGIEYIDDFKPSSCPVDEKITAVRAAAGHTGVEVQAELAKHGRIIVTGANPDVGLVGWLTAGGHGTLSQTYGMGADNLLEATIVTPDGNVLLANPCTNADIFFALRGGGGGTYGVVTEVVLKTFPTPKTSMHFFELASLSPNTSTEFWDFIGFLHAEMPRLKEGGMQGYYYFGGIPTVPTLSFRWFFLLYDKPDNTAAILMAPIEVYLKERAHLFAYQVNISHAPTYFDLYGSNWPNELVATGGAALGSRLLSPESLADANVTAKVFASIGPSTDPSKPNGPLANPVIIGHMIASPNAPSYYPTTSSVLPAWRHTLTHLIVVSGWLDGTPRPLIDAVYTDLTHNKIAALRQLSPDTGAYFNEADPYEPEWQRAFFGEHYERLRAVKEKYDPRSVLWCKSCVGSEGLVERGSGELCWVEGRGRRADGGMVEDGHWDL